MYSLKVATLAALASTVIAQSLPSCASNCVTNYNGCNQLDVSCICNSSQWIAGLACCVAEVCDAADQEETIEFANTICAGVGVTTLPQSATCTSGASTYSTAAATVSASVSASGSAATSTATASSTTSTTAATASTSTSATTTAKAATTTGAANINKAGSVGIGALIAGLAVVL